MKHNAKNLSGYGNIVLKELTKYLSRAQGGKVPVLNQDTGDKIAKNLGLNELISSGIKTKGRLKRFTKTYLTYTQMLQHPHFIGHQTAVPHINSAFADFIHGVINNPMSIYEMGPSAAVLERYVINWMLKKVGWFEGDNLELLDANPNNGAGILTHGGSMANLTALLSARAYASPNAWVDGNQSNLVVLAPAVSHYSMARSISIMGLGQKALIPVAVNELEIMIPDMLKASIIDQQSQGKKIVAVVANACATSSGLYDPIDEIADICKEFGIWFHVDGAHGASALLCKNEKHLLKGVKKANSLTWDAHKMLKTSTLCAAVLYKYPNEMSSTFDQKASYLFHEKESLGFDTLAYQIECTKASLGSKLFFALAAEGEKKISSYIQSKYDDTKKYYTLINETEDFECPYYPESNILCFRYIPLGNDNAAQLRLRNELINRGNFYITSAEFNGTRYLRLSVMNPKTSLKHIKKLLNEIRGISQDMK